MFNSLYWIREEEAEKIIDDETGDSQISYGGKGQGSAVSSPLLQFSLSQAIAKLETKEKKELGKKLGKACMDELISLSLSLSLAISLWAVLAAAQLDSTDA